MLDSSALSRRRQKRFTRIPPNNIKENPRISYSEGLDIPLHTLTIIDLYIYSKLTVLKLREYQLKIKNSYISKSSFTS